MLGENIKIAACAFPALFIFMVCAAGAGDGADGGAHLFDRFDRFPAVAVPRTNIPPVIDGVIEDDEWKNAGHFTGLMTDMRVDELPSHFYLTYDDEALYIAFRMIREEGAPARITVENERSPTSMFRSDDSMELSLSMDEERRVSFSYFVNAAGGYTDGVVGPGRSYDASARYDWVYRSRQTEQGVEGELKVPVSEVRRILEERGGFKPAALSPGREWGFGPQRNDIIPEQRISDWSRQWGGFGGWYSGNRLGRLIFVDRDTPLVRVERMGRLGEDSCGVEYSITNPDDSERIVEAEYAIYRAVTDVARDGLSIFRTWDIVMAFREEDTGMLAGLPPEDQIGAGGHMSRIDDAYELVESGNEEIILPSASSGAYGFSVSNDSGQFVFAYRFTDKETGSTLLSEVKPVDVKPPLALDIEKRFLTTGGVVIMADAGSAPGLGDKGEIFFELRRADGGAILKEWTKEITGDNRYSVEMVVGMEEYPEGDYYITGKVFDCSGRMLAEEDGGFSKPEMPDWSGNDIGYTTKVPPPWEPVRANLKRTNVWGRSFVWGRNNPLPVQIENQGRNMLVSPLTISAWKGGRKIDMKTSLRLARKTGQQALYHARVAGEGLEFEVNTQIEFDGFMKISVDLPAGTEIDGLVFGMELVKDAATHYGSSHRGTDMVTADRALKAGRLEDYFERNPGGGKGFAGYFFLGDGDIGIQWVCEEDRYWSVSDRDRVTFVEDKGDRIAFNVNFIDVPVKLDERRSIEFALMPAPVKDISWYLDYKVNTLVGVTGYRSGVDIEALREGFDRSVRAGITHHHSSGGRPRRWGHVDVWLRNICRDDFRTVVQEANKKGLEVYIYGCWAYNMDGEEAEDFAADMIKRPRQPSGWNTYWYNPEGPFVDFFMAGLRNSVREFGIAGIYLDSMVGTNIQYDPHMDIGYIDEDGRRRGKWPTFALREWAKRMYSLMKITESTDSIVFQHGSLSLLPITSFADFVCSGEGIANTERLLNSLDPEMFRVEMYARQYGIPHYTIWHNWWNRPLRQNQMLAATLLFGQFLFRDDVVTLPTRIDQSDYGLESQPHISLLNIYKNFGIRGAEWVPYWKSGDYVLMSGGEHLKSSMHLYPGEKALVVVSNLAADPVEARVKFNLSKMGFNGGVKATDALLGNGIELDADGMMELDIDYERYRLIIIKKN